MYRIRREERSAVDAFAALVIVLIIVAGVMGVLLYSHMTQEPHESPDILSVKEHDEIEFTYTGYLMNTLVFETVLEDVAIDNETYPKSLLYEWPENGVFGDIFFVVGDGIPHYTFEGMAGDGEILELAMLGMQANETKMVTVTPEHGFGDVDPSKIVTLGLTETLDIMEVMTWGDFGDRFGTPAVVNATFTDPRWGWNVRVTNIQGGLLDREVIIINLPEVDDIVSPYQGFESKVISVESGANGGIGEIVIEHLLDSSDVNKVMGVSPHDDGRFAVVGVNQAAGTFVADFNSEKAGVNLLYEITIVSITER
jgi:FKBP-type peptidyl-prolyl cis-trans isomerase 2